MSVLGKLASALGRNDEQPNVELAEALAARPDAAAVAELAGALATGPTAVSNDAIKVLYELGALKPELVAPHAAAGHGAKALPILLERLDGAAPNQFPMYAEQALPVIDASHRAAFVRLLEARLGSIEASAKRTRVEKVLRKAKA